jgi:membrane associated rhomboid family serine protease
MISNLPPALKNILIIMILGAMAQTALPNIGIDPYQWYLYYPDSSNFRIWQLITHIFCHGGFSHILFNAIALFSFGMVVEYRLGTARFLKLFFISGLGAVLLHFVWIGYQVYSQAGTFFPNLAAGQDFVQYPPMLGASGALYGVMTAFAVLYPEERMIFLFIPYPIKAKFLVPGIIAIDVIFGLLDLESDNIAHFAHIGGALLGFIIVKFWQRKNNYV